MQFSWNFNRLFFPFCQDSNWRWKIIGCDFCLWITGKESSSHDNRTWSHQPVGSKRAEGYSSSLSRLGLGNVHPCKFTFMSGILYVYFVRMHLRLFTKLSRLVRETAKPSHRMKWHHFQHSSVLEFSFCPIFKHDSFIKEL